MKGETVRLREAPALEGYTFSGWTVKNLEVQDGTFPDARRRSSGLR